MRAVPRDLWGCARGPVLRLAPHTRIAAGAGVGAACLVAPATSAAGLGVVAGAVAAWLWACRPPRRVIAYTAAFGLAMFLPYFLLVPLIAAEGTAAPGNAWGAFAAPWSVVVRGLACMAASIGTVTALGMSDLREGLLRLPLPSVATLIVLQIIHQSGALLAETQRMAAALALRGASGGGLSAVRVLAALPRVWLPRAIDKAERVAAAMELRGYCEETPRSSAGARAGGADAVAAAAVALALALAGAARWLEAA